MLQAERNSNLEEAARLKGTVAALEAQVQVMPAAAWRQLDHLQSGLQVEAARLLVWRAVHPDPWPYL